MVGDRRTVGHRLLVRRDARARAAPVQRLVRTAHALVGAARGRSARRDVRRLCHRNLQLRDPVHVRAVALVRTDLGCGLSLAEPARLVRPPRTLEPRAAGPDQRGPQPGNVPDHADGRCGRARDRPGPARSAARDVSAAAAGRDRGSGEGPGGGAGDAPRSGRGRRGTRPLSESLARARRARSPHPAGRRLQPEPRLPAGLRRPARGPGVPAVRRGRDLRLLPARVRGGVRSPTSRRDKRGWPPMPGAGPGSGTAPGSKTCSATRACTRGPTRRGSTGFGRTSSEVASCPTRWSSSRNSIAPSGS